MSNRTISADGRLLLEAADEIRKHGWCQGGFINSKGNICLVKAILRVAPDVETSTRLRWRMNKHLGTSPMFWNDGHGRTKQEVLIALESCALSQRS